MTEPTWLGLAVVLAMHADQMREHGGSLGLRDRGVLESALDRPRNAFHYGGVLDLCASSYGYGIARNHPFVDGNERVAFQAMYVFLGVNGVRVEAEEPEVVQTMLALAEGALDEAALAEWLQHRTRDW